MWTTFAVGSHDQMLLVKRSCQNALDYLQNGPVNSFSLATSYASNHSNENQASEHIPEFLFNNSSDISLAYAKKWVGFPKIAGSNCAAAFNSSAKNSDFPQKVERVFPDQFLVDSKDCRGFVEKYGFGRHPKASQEEIEFPICECVGACV